MKTSKNKWNGTKITLNYIGNLNNKFGVKKKKIIIEEDKLQPLFQISNDNNLLSERLKKNNNKYFRNSTKIKNDNIRMNFNSIHLEDWEKVNNYNFYNYFKYFNYFQRINNSKRILSSNNNDKLKLNKNKSSFALFEKEFYENIKKEEKNVYSSRGRAKSNFSVVKNIKNSKNKRKLSKKNISDIISNFITQRNTEKKNFNYKNKAINDSIKTKNLLLNFACYNLKKNPIKKNNYINQNDINLDSNYYNMSPFNLYLKRDKKGTDKRNNKKTLNSIKTSNISSNSHIKLSINKNKEYFINNINKNKNNIIHSKNNIQSIRKCGTFCDVGTNTDF